MGMDCDKGALQRLAARQINANLRAGEVGRDLKRYFRQPLTNGAER